MHSLLLILVLLLVAPVQACINDEEVRHNEDYVKALYTPPHWTEVFQTGDVIVPVAGLLGVLLLIDRRRK